MFWNHSDRTARQVSALIIGVFPVILTLCWAFGLMPWRIAAMSMVIYAVIWFGACALWILSASIVLGIVRVVIRLIYAAGHSGHRHKHA